MSEINNFEFFFETRSGQKLYSQRWTPPLTKARLILFHGLGDHSDRYKNLALFLANKGIETLCFDQQGHGRSPGQRGYISNFSQFINDAVDFIDFCVDDKKTKPIYLMGHSMGGLIAPFAFSQRSLKIDGLILSSPALGLKVKPNKLKMHLTEISHRYFPRLTLWNQIHVSDLSKDQSFQKRTEKDPYFHNQISATLYLGMLDAIEKLPTILPSLKGPLLFLIGKKDPVLDHPSIELLFNRIETTQKEWLIYPEGLHELFNDFEKEQVQEALLLFIQLQQN